MVICSAADVVEVQVDVANLADEISALGLRLNSQKTKAMLASQKKHQPELLWKASQYVWFGLLDISASSSCQISPGPSTHTQCV